MQEVALDTTFRETQHKKSVSKDMEFRTDPIRVELYKYINGYVFTYLHKAYYLWGV